MPSNINTTLHIVGQATRKADAQDQANTMANESEHMGFLPGDAGSGRRERWGSDRANDFTLMDDYDSLQSAFSVHRMVVVPGKTITQPLGSITNQTGKTLFGIGSMVRSSDGLTLNNCSGFEIYGLGMDGNGFENNGIYQGLTLQDCDDITIFDFRARELADYGIRLLGSNTNIRIIRPVFDGVGDVSLDPANLEYRTKGSCIDMPSGATVDGLELQSVHARMCNGHCINLTCDNDGDIRDLLVNKTFIDSQAFGGIIVQGSGEVDGVTIIYPQINRCGFGQTSSGADCKGISIPNTAEDKAASIRGGQIDLCEDTSIEFQGTVTGPVISSTGDNADTLVASRDSVAAQPIGLVLYPGSTAYGVGVNYSARQGIELRSRGGLANGFKITACPIKGWGQIGSDAHAIGYWDAASLIDSVVQDCHLSQVSGASGDRAIHFANAASSADIKNNSAYGLTTAYSLDNASSFQNKLNGSVV